MRTTTKINQRAKDGAAKEGCIVLEKHTRADNQYKYLLFHAGSSQIFLSWGAPVEKGRFVVPGFKKNIKRYEERTVTILDSHRVEFLREVKPPGLRCRMDFFLPKYNVCIEIDESHHSAQVLADKAREEEIKKAIPGITILRVGYKNLEADLEILIKNL